MYRRRALLAATPALLIGGCFGNTGTSQAAQDAKLIATAVTPVAQSAASLGAPPATLARIDQSLATVRGEAATMASDFSTGLLDAQEFLAAAQTLLGTLSGLGNLPPASMGIVDAAIALLPVFAAIAERPVALPARMTAEQARLILQGTRANPVAVAPTATPAPTPTAPSPITPSPTVSSPTTRSPTATATASKAGRFHLSANDFDGAISYEFWDGATMIERGTVASLAVLQTQFAAFKKQRLQQSP